MKSAGTRILDLIPKEGRTDCGMLIHSQKLSLVALVTALIVLSLAISCWAQVASASGDSSGGTCDASGCEVESSYAKFSENADEWVMPNALFESCLEEVSNADLPIVYGNIPSWLDGTLYRVGPGLYELGERRVNNMVDALSKVHRWSFGKNGEATFTSSFLKSSIYNRTRENNELVAIRHLGQMHPPASTMEKLQIMFYDSLPDNNNIAAWELGKSGVTITAESHVYIDVDFRSLNFQKKYSAKSDNTGVFESEFLSASHFWRHPSSGDSINYKIVIPLDKGILSKNEGPAYHLYRYKENSEGDIDAKFVGRVPIEKGDFRVVHTLGATENYIVLPRFSLYVDFNDPVDIGQNIKFSSAKPVFMDVVSMKDGSRKQFTFDAHESQHIFNSFERYNEKNELEIVVDYPTLDSVDNVPDKNIFELLNIETLTNPEFQYAEHWEAYTQFRIRRFILNMDTGAGHIYDYPQMWSPKNLQVEFPYINDAYRGLPYCYVYLQTWHHDTHNAMGIMKVDMCREKSIGWQEVNKFPVEPVFAARPDGAEEDDGIIMSPVLDSTDNSTSLYIWDAKNLEVLTILSTPITVPFTLHGVWISGV